MVDAGALEAAQAYALGFFAHEPSGHDVQHTLRVQRLALRIAAEEGADKGIVGLAALLHDVDDAKLSPATSEGLDNARSFLAAQGIAGAEARAILTAIREVSFSQNRDRPPSTIEAACVRDADRLDALGAIGVARTFAFGGAHGRALHDPEHPSGTSIQHFYDKLLLLKDMMCTSAGRAIAVSRDRYLRAFLDEFLAEWDARS